MIYLYAALGMVMMTGIMTVVEMGLSLTGQSMLLKPGDLYQQNFVTEAVGKRDQQMLNLLHDQDDLDAIGRSLQGSELCDQLTLVGVSQPAEDGFLSNACALQVGMHRLLIQPDPAPVDPQIPYRLFSCYLAGSSTCELESNS